MSLIARSKFGDCSRCNATDVDCKKRGKFLICNQCCKVEDTQKQIDKAKVKNSLHRLKKYQREETDNMDSVQELVIDIDRVLSRYIRLRDAGMDGKVICYPWIGDGWCWERG